MSFLGYFFMGLPYAIAAAFALFLVVLVVGAAHTPWVVLSMLGAALIAETASIYPLALNFGVWIYPGDFFAIIAAGALLFRLVVYRLWHTVHWAWWLFGAIQAALFLWGMTLHGTGAGVDYRTHFAAWVGAAYLATFSQDERHLKRILVAMQVIALCLVSVALYRWIGSALDPLFARKIDYFVTTGVAYRVIWSAPTLMIAMAMLISLFFVLTRPGQGPRWLLVMGLGVIVLVLQHRSVWVATLGGVAVLWWALSRSRVGMGLRMLGVSLGFLLVAVFALSSFRGVSSSIELQTERAVSAGGTFAGGRVASWEALLRDWAASGSPATYLVGKPFGGGYERFTGEVVHKSVTYQPHNYYIHLLYRGGLIGLACFLIVMWMAWRASYRRMQAGDRWALLLLALQATLMLFYIPYAVSYDHALLLSLLLGAAATQRATQPTPAVEHAARSFALK